MESLTTLAGRPDAAKKLRALLDCLEGEDTAKQETELKIGATRILAALLESRNANTARIYRQDLETFAKWLGVLNIGMAVLEMLKCTQGSLNEMILRYRRDLESSMLSSATINHRIVVLRECLKLGRQFGVVMLSVEVKGLPAERCKNMAGPPVEKVLEVLRELSRSQAPTHVRDRCLICFYFYAALRASEALGLDFPTHVDLSRGIVSILGKKRRMRQEVTLPAPALESLVAWLAVRGMGKGPLFTRTRTWTNCQDNGRVGRHTIFNNLKGYGLLRIHALRHTAATAAASIGAPLQDIQALLRHASPATTARYLDNTPERAIEISKKLGERFDTLERM